MKTMVPIQKNWLPGLLVILPCLFFSCKKILDKQPESSLAADQVYRNVFDADAAITGIYGKLMGLAKQYVILNELRADLMDVTDNADADLREISNHSVSANNPYADPGPFYSLINNCNDVLKNFNIMLAQKKFKDIEYQQRYSDVGAIRLLAVPAVRHSFWESAVCNRCT